ncbi:MAG: prepilin-type N-terminal cleavage/methylation domain-containing protein [Lactobacillales bacterium]|nr:prepilin-type N-terminal cleavage/methylation domain-containing protein [Lactobacillales bacterium]
MKKSLINKKGFTLVELLAVIVILAVIALIAVPITLNVLEDSKKSSIKVGTVHYIDTLEDKLEYGKLNNEELDSGMYKITENGNIEVNGEEKELSMKGTLPNNGTICVDDRGLVESYSVVIDGYVVTNTTGTQKIEAGTTPKSLTCNVAEETVEIVIPENGAVCSQNKIVEIIYPEYEEIAKEYSLDKEKWEKYTGPVTMTKNGTIYARLRDIRNDKVSGIATHTFGTIDNTKVTKTAPTLILSNERPTSEIQVTLKQTDNCGIDENTIMYGISTTKDGEYKWQKEAVFSKLKNNTTYYIKTKLNDIANNGIIESETSEITTRNFGTCNIEISDYGKWTPSKNVTITGETVSGTTLQYRVYESSVKKDTDWLDITNGKKITLDNMATDDEPTTVYCRYVEKENDGTILNTVDPAISKSISKIDITKASLVTGDITKTTRSITIPYTATDSQSGIESTICEYGTSTSYGNKGVVKDSKCVIENIKSGTTYYYRLVTTNNSGLKTTVTGNTTTTSSGSCNIEISDENIWKTSKTATITGKLSQGENLQYKIVSGTTIKTDWTTISSGKKEILNWAANTDIPTHVYCRVVDGTNTTDGTTKTQTRIDITKADLTIGTISKTTNSLLIPYTAIDPESGISEITCEYGTSTSYGSKGVVKDSKCVIENAKSGTTYYYKLETTNNSGLKTTVTGNTATVISGSCDISISNENTWKTSKIATINGELTSGENLQYKVVSGTTTKTDWTTVSSGTTATLNWEATTATPTYLYCRVVDGTNTTNGTTKTQTKIDPSAPLITVGTITKTTKNITIPYTATDSQSGINKTTCEYGTSTSYGSIGTVSDGKCTISNAKSGTTYYYRLVTTNNSGLTKTVTGNTATTATGTCEVTITDENAWKPSKTATIKGNITTGESLQYRVISGTTEKVVWTTVSSGKTQTINWEATTTTPTHIYCRVTDGVNTKDGTTKTQTKIDPSVPLITVGTITKTTKSISIPYTATDSQSGISGTTCEYGTSTSYGSTGTISDGKCTISNAKSGTTYYYRLVTTNNSGLTQTVTGNTATTATGTCEVTITDENVWKTSKTATIKGNITTGESLQYRVVSGTTEKVAWTTISSGKTQTINWAANTTTPTYVYCRVTDGVNTKSGTTKTQTTVDITEPTLTIGTITKTTKSVSIPISASDAESGIKSTTCKLGTSSGNYTITGTISNNVCTASGLKNTTKYYYEVVTTNGANVSVTKTGNTDTNSFGSVNITQNTASCSTSKTMTVTGTTAGAQLQYQLGGTSGTWTNISSGGTFTLTSNTTVYARLWDGTNASSTASYSVTTVDRTGPNAPTIALAYGTAPSTVAGTYNSGIWTSSHIRTTASTTDNGCAGIAYYQYSHDGSSWGSDISTLGWNSSYDNTTTKTSLSYWITWTGQWDFYVRAVDNLGNAGPASAKFTERIDNTAPSIPTVTYNGGSNTCSWKNNYNYTLTSSDNVALAYYEVDWDGDGVANTTTNSNFVPWNGYSSCNNRFRAVDHMGNKSGWTDVHHIHMDTQAPSQTSMSLNGYSSGAWTNGNVTQSASATDNVGVSYYQYSHDGVNVAGTFPNPWTINWDGQWNFYVRAIDHAGNVGAWSGVYTIRRDATAPSAPSISNPTGGGWTNSNFSLTLSSTDNLTGIGYYQYSYDNANWTTYGSSNVNTFTTTAFSAERNQLAYLRACDNLGNCSASSSTYIRIDKTKPACGSWSGGSTSWTASDRTIKVGCTDTSGSGCTASTYSKTYTASKKTATPSITIKDNAGNTNSCSKEVNVYVDKTAPTITMVPVAGSYKSGSTTVKVQCEDSHSGMKQAWLSDAGTVTTGTSSTSQSLSTVSTRTASGKCTDKVGNVSTASRKYTITSSGGGGSATGCNCSGGCVCGSGVASTECMKGCGFT